MQYFESCGLSLLPPEKSSAATPAALQPPRELDDSLLRVSALDEFDSRKPHDQRKIRQRVFDPRDRFEQEPARLSNEPP